MNQVNHELLFSNAKSIPTELDLQEVAALLSNTLLQPRSSNKFKIWSALGLLSICLLLMVGLNALDSEPTEMIMPIHTVEKNGPKTNQAGGIYLDANDADSTQREVMAPKDVQRKSISQVEIEEQMVATKPSSTIPRSNATTSTSSMSNASPLKEDPISVEAETDTTDTTETDCDCCECGSNDVFRYNEHLATGYMSFYFNCNEGGLGVALTKTDLKELKKTLWKLLKKDNNIGLKREVRIDYRISEIRVNQKKLSEEDTKDYMEIFRAFGVEAGSSRTILIDKDQIWVGDFSNDKFYGAAMGRNIKRSLADGLIKSDT